jgi:hypothetical protein
VAHGVPDGEHLQREHVLSLIRDVVGAVRVPVTIDLEAGYSATPTEVGALVRQLVDLGIAGPVGSRMSSTQSRSDIAGRRSVPAVPVSLLRGDVARKLGISVESVRRLARRAGLPPTYDACGSAVYDEDALSRLVDEHARRVTPAVQDDFDLEVASKAFGMFADGKGPVDVVLQSVAGARLPPKRSSSLRSFPLDFTSNLGEKGIGPRAGRCPGAVTDL